MQTNCAQCNAPMTCDVEGNCWCKEVPHGPMPTAPAEELGCLCRPCLEARLAGLETERPASP